MSIRSTSEAHREGSESPGEFSEIEQSSGKHQRPQRERNGAPIVLMMLVYVARAPRTQASSGDPFLPRWGL